MLWSLSDVFRNVTRQAGLEPKQISVVEAPGTGTPVGDPAEYESLRRVFGGSIRSKSLSVGSVKGLVGHTECASGIVALIKMLLIIHEGIIPPQASFDAINPAIKASPSDNMEVVTHLKPWDVDFRAAVINNYGASGSNASMLVTQAPKHFAEAVDSSTIHSAGSKHPFWFCGLDEQSIRAYSARFLKFLRSKVVSARDASIENLAYNVSRQSNRSLGQALIFSCDSVNELEQKLTAFEKGDKSVSAIARQSPRPVILCFGGQVSTFVGLNRPVYESFKILRSYLNECNVVCQSIGLDGIYPETFQRTPVEDTVKLQTMLFAMQYSCAKTWIDYGIQAAALVGHSCSQRAPRTRRRE
jgi:acyl transferase domain-containing protein